MPSDPLARKKEKARKLWTRIAKCLDFYKHRISPAALFFSCREGWYVLIVMGLHLLFTSVATQSSWIGVVVAAISVLLLFDTLTANTAIVFGEILGIHPLRSVVLTMWAYFNVALSFAPAWALLYRGPEPIWWKRVVTAIYQSLRTLATVGPDGNVESTSGQVIATVELLIGVYFLATILAIYVSWAGNVHVRGGDQSNAGASSRGAMEVPESHGLPLPETKEGLH